MDLKFNQHIGINGKLRIKSIDINTGKIISINEGNNLVLNTGLEDLCYLLSGNILLPQDAASGRYLSDTAFAVNHLPIYGQFGTNGSVPVPNDVSSFPNGTLDPSVTSPTIASNILTASAYYPATNSVTIQFSLPPSLGNGVANTGTVYREAVLMSRVSDTPIIYKWFSRRVFPDMAKNSTTMLVAEWQFTFTAVKE